MQYVCRMDRGQASYYILRGPILVLSKQEDILKQALDREQALDHAAEPPLTRELKALGVDRALMVLWLNPRALDAAVEARGKTGEAEVHKTVTACWKALQSVAVALHLDRNLSLSLALRGRLEELPPATRKLFAEAGQPCELSRLFAEDPLLALAGRLDLAALVSSVSEFLPAKSRQELQAKLQPLGAAVNVLPSLGPDMGLMLVAPSRRDKGSWTPDAWLALRVGAGAKAVPVDRSTIASLRFLAVAPILAYNSANPDNPIALKYETRGGRDITYLTGKAFGPGLQPAFALHQGYLILASSPEVIARFVLPAPGTLPPMESVPLLRVSFKAWRAYLKERRKELVDAMTAKKEITPLEAGAKLDQLQAGLHLVERLELRQKTSKDLVTLTLSLQPTQPFKK